MRPVLIQFGLLGLVILLTVPVNASATGTVNESAKLLPDRIENFHASSPAIAPIGGLIKTGDEVLITSTATRDYSNDAGSIFLIELNQTENDSAAYALLTQSAGAEGVKRGGVGVASFLRTDRVAFCKGNALVRIIWTGSPTSQNQMLSVAQSLAATLPGGDDDVPVLVMHLPDWQEKLSHSAYAVTLAGLGRIVPDQPILNSVSFDGGTEAVVANYGQSQLVVVEFTTPQFSIENDNRIWTKIAELKSQNQPTPIAYRRVGNYSVFVFNAPDEKTANALVDQVKYEQVVQWLGDDPHMAERLTRYFRRTTSGVLFAVLKSSGLSLILCAGIGALIGALLFRHRRARQAAFYSDAGGSTRLNLDELTDPNKSQRLLGPAAQPGADS